MKKLVSYIVCAGILLNLVTPAFAEPSGTVADPTVRVEKEQAGRWKRFWNTKSKKKLWWGVALTVLGGAGAVYGFSKRMETITETRTTYKTVNDPAAIEGLPSFSLKTTSSDGKLDTITYGSRHRNNSQYAAKDVKLKVTCSWQGTVYGETTVTQANLAYRGEFDWSTTLDLQPNPESVSFPTVQVTQALFSVPTVEKVPVEKPVLNNPTIGLVGIGSAIVGASFLISYMLSTHLPTEISRNVEVTPYAFFTETAGSQGLNISYKF